MKTAVVLTVAILANAFGNLLLSKGMHDYASTSPSIAMWLYRAAIHVVTDPWMIAGVLLLIVFLAAYMAALSWADLSFVLPATAPAYILTEVLAKIYLNETVSLARWGGTFLIVAGTCLVARSFVTPDERAPREAPAGSLAQ